MATRGPGEKGSSLVIHLFGPFEAWVDGHPLPRLRSRKVQSLLALLALRARLPVERSWVAGVLWPDSPESTALATLRRDLTSLRRALGLSAGRLRSPTHHTLCFDLEEGEVDLLAFDAGVARGDPISLERAVSLYRGPLLEGSAEEWVFLERQAREQAYLDALERLAAVALAGGDHVAAERHLHRAIAVDPLRESAQRGLMQALAAGGSAAAALRAYQELCLLLRQDLDADPDRETRDLFAQIQSQAAGRAERSGSLPPPGRARHDLPVPRTPLLGRERELAAVRQMLWGGGISPPASLETQRARRDAERERKKGTRAGDRAGILTPSPLHPFTPSFSRLVTLTGPGGTGKTRLALQVAVDLADRFEHGVSFVDLAPIRDPALVVSTLVQTLGIRETGNQPLLGRLKQYLEDRHLLLVLDNFEHVLQAAPIVAELLTAAPRLKILVTSRTVLRLRGEQDYPVSPLPVPDPERLPSLPALSQYAAVELFIQRATNARPDFAVTNENAPAVAEICHRLDGLPLAIELAAARMKLFSPQALLARLRLPVPTPLTGGGAPVARGAGPRERRPRGAGAPAHSPLQLLTGGARDLPARQQTLRNTIDWSYDLLNESERTLFRRLSVFDGGCTLEAAEAVCGGALDVLASLVDQSLLQQQEQADGEPRLGMLATIREYGWECLDESGETETIRRQHAHYYLTLAEAAYPKVQSAERVEWHERLERERGNLQTALSWGQAAPEGDDTLLRLVGALAYYWAWRGNSSEGRRCLEAALTRSEANDRTLVRAKALFGLGHLAWLQGDIETARAPLDEAVAIWREVGDRRSLAGVLNILGWVARDLGDHAAGRALLEESMGIAREVGDRWSLTQALLCRGNLATNQGALDEAQSHFEEALAVSREVGDEMLAAWSLVQLMGPAFARGDFRRARGLAEESLAIFRQFGDTVGLTAPLQALGDIACIQGDYDTARALHEENLAIRREMGDRLEAVMSLNALGGIARGLGDRAAARALYEEGLASCRGMEDRMVLAWTLHNMAILSRDEGDVEPARTLHEESLAIFREMNHPRGTAHSLGGLARVVQDQGDYEAAQALHEESLALFREREDQRGIAFSLEGLASVALARQAVTRAARLLGTAAALRDTLGALLAPVDRAETERHVAAVRAALGEEGFAAAWAEIRAMKIEEAIRAALP